MYRKSKASIMKDWTLIIGVTILTLCVTLSVCYGMYALAVDTAIKVIHNP